MMPQLLREARNDAARSVHVATVLLSEPIEHHPLLAGIRKPYRGVNSAKLAQPATQFCSSNACAMPHSHSEAYISGA